MSGTENKKIVEMLIRHLQGEGFCNVWSVDRTKVGGCRTLVKIMLKRALPVLAKQNDTNSEQFCEKILGLCSLQL